ncbi:MAG: MerR family transcriptional regulator [Firmicutes bacterium]|nr:MerR family transcriptional regulator [Bacillota bacterium]
MARTDSWENLLIGAFSGYSIGIPWHDQKDVAEKRINFLYGMYNFVDHLPRIYYDGVGVPFVEDVMELPIHGPDEPVYTISVMARLVGVSTQVLRIWERESLVCPARTEKNNRLYSENDFYRLVQIRDLKTPR